MILVDTNVLVALADERDALHRRAKRDLRKMTPPFGVTSVVLSETFFLLEESYLRARLGLLLERLPIQPVEPDVPWWSEVLVWMARYADHRPDLCDGMLAVLGARIPASIWTYDREFRRLWRRPDGKPLAVMPPVR